MENRRWFTIQYSINILVLIFILFQTNCKKSVTNIDVPGGSGDPAIEFTYVPPYGSFDDLEGQVWHVSPANYKVAVYIYVSSWWTKPIFANPLTAIKNDGSWACDVTTGGVDQNATKIAAYLVPNGYNPPLMDGDQTLSSELAEKSVAKAEVEREPKIRTIIFSGYKWKVKSSESKAGPGPNYFSDKEEDVWVDNEGKLHLKITKKDGKWYCTEVISDSSFGYGKYIFYVASRVDQLDKNIVVGLFTWDTFAPEHNYREIDIEFAKWGQATNENAQYVVQPYTNPANMKRFNIKLNGDYSTHIFDWQPDTIFFQSINGHCLSPPDSNYLIQSWIYTGKDIPPADGENARINFWLFRGEPPSDGNDAEVIIKAFEFVPI